MIEGPVKVYNDIQGFGFIQPDDGSKDVLVHATTLERSDKFAVNKFQKA